MLPAELRMRRSREFESTIRSGVRAGRRTLVVHCRRRDGSGQQVGFVVGRAIGGAVVRNRVRRQLRAVVVEERAELPEGTDLVVRCLPAAAGSTYQELAQDFRGAVRTALARAGRS